MRFCADGPSIPDELLLARDEGRVVFFCGAGVSRARAGLPDFLELAKRVATQLLPTPTGDAAVLLESLGNPLRGQRDPLVSLFPIDRLFGLLEREFRSSDIRRAIASALKTDATPDDSCHDILLRLARTPDDQVRLVTTNFDRLFEGPQPAIRTWEAPRLPYLDRDENLDGIVYLHGRLGVNEKDSGDLVVSTGDFGRAYLSQGWARRFVESVLEQFIVVFVGYSAEDPPMAYMLEGLRKHSKQKGRLYAFQSAGDLNRWRDKNVVALTYELRDSGRSHDALWESLGQWADRADDPDAWRSRIVEMAKKGPTSLSPHQRGQVAHLVSTTPGAQAFAIAQAPAEWLLVFDSDLRIKASELAHAPSQPDRYRLDESYECAGPEAGLAESESTPWDAFRPLWDDLKELEGKGGRATGVKENVGVDLSSRQKYLAKWIAQVMRERAAIFWAARLRSSPHFQVVEWLKSGFLDLSPTDDSDAVWIWQRLLLCWSSFAGDRKSLDHQWAIAFASVRRFGWTLPLAAEVIRLSRPIIRCVFAGEATGEGVGSLRSHARFRVEFYSQLDPDHVPDEYLPVIVRGVRACLELAAEYSRDLGDVQAPTLKPITEDDSIQSLRRGVCRDYSDLIRHCAALYVRLLRADQAAARRELHVWAGLKHSVFARLSVWALSQENAASAAECGKILRSLEQAFYDDVYNHRDLLFTLKRRWYDLSEGSRRHVERRLLSSDRVGGDSGDGREAAFRQRGLRCLKWLQLNGCCLSLAMQSEVEKISEALVGGELDPARSPEPPTGWVRPDTTFETLRQLPVEQIVSRAADMSGVSWHRSFVEQLPFRGMCKEMPRKALRALIRSEGTRDAKVKAWQEFLEVSAESKLVGRLTAVTARHLLRLPQDEWLRLLLWISRWLEKKASQLSCAYPAGFDEMTDRLVETLRADPEAGGASIQEMDWLTRAINSPVGMTTEAVLADRRITGGKPGSVQKVLDSLGRLLDLPEELPCFVIAILASRFVDLHATDSEWSERHLVSVVNSENRERKMAFWNGWSYSPQWAGPEHFVTLKSSFLATCLEIGEEDQRMVEAFAGSLLFVWRESQKPDGPTLLTDGEFLGVLRDGSDALRCQVIYEIEERMAKEDGEPGSFGCDMVQRLLEIAWPRHSQTKSRRVTKAFIDLLFSSDSTFQCLFETCLGLVGPIENGDSLRYVWYRNGDEICRTEPRGLLKLLIAIAPESTRDWGPFMGEVLQSVVKMHPEFANDAEWRELNQKWREC